MPEGSRTWSRSRRSKKSDGIQQQRSRSRRDGAKEPGHGFHSSPSRTPRRRPGAAPRCDAHVQCNIYSNKGCVVFYIHGA